jgi:hypothetical protein
MSYRPSRRRLLVGIVAIGLVVGLFAGAAVARGTVSNSTRATVSSAHGLAVRRMTASSLAFRRLRLARARHFGLARRRLPRAARPVPRKVVPTTVARSARPRVQLRRRAPVRSARRRVRRGRRKVRRFRHVKSKARHFKRKVRHVKHVRHIKRNIVKVSHRSYLLRI